MKRIGVFLCLLLMLISCNDKKDNQAEDKAINQKIIENQSQVNQEIVTTTSTSTTVSTTTTVKIVATTTTTVVQPKGDVVSTTTTTVAKQPQSKKSKNKRAKNAFDELDGVFDSDDINGMRDDMNDLQNMADELGSF